MGVFLRDPGPPDVLVDFNEVYDDDYVWAVIRDQVPSASIEEGVWVRLYDIDGAACLGIVTHKGGRTIDCKIDWSTWSDSSGDFSFYGSYQFVPSADSRTGRAPDSRFVEA